jgi:release factor glutamine methyltransferase
VDVGTGCGAIAISVALESETPIVATDVSPLALTLARENAAAIDARVRCVATDLLNGLLGGLHVVLANLPYVPSHRSLPRDVADYEPAVALFGGQRGTELIERLLHEARPLLAPGAEVCVELDEEEQATPVADLARALYPLADVEVRQDAGGYDRVVRVLT